MPLFGSSNSIAASFGGNTSGALALVSSGTLVIAGGNNITVSQNGNSVTISGGNTSQFLTTADLSQNSSKYAGINGAITGGSITVNTSGVSVNLPAYLTTARGSTDAIGLNTAKTNVTWTANSSGLSLDAGGYAGTVTGITGGSLTVNTAGVSLNLPAYLTTAMQSNAATLSNIKVSAGAASALLSDLTFSNSNGLAFGLSGSTITGSYTVPTVTAGSDTFGISNLGNTAGTSGVVSADALRVLFAGGNNVTLSQSVNGASATITISGPNTSAQQTGISGIIVSDATYTSGTVSFSNAGNITIGSSVNGATQFIKLSGNAAQTNQSAIKGFGVSNTGQTAGNTGISTGIDWVLAGSQSITLSQSTAVGGPNTVWFQHPAWLTTAALSQDSSKYAGTAGAVTNGSITVNTAGVSVNIPNLSQSAGASNLGNTLGTSGVASGGQVKYICVGDNNVTISQSVNGASVTQSIQAGGTNRYNINTLGMIGNVNAQIGNSSLHFQQFPVGEPFTATAVGHLVSVSHSSSADSRTLNLTVGLSVGLYTRSGSTLNLVTGSSGTQSYGVTISSQDSTASFSGQRLLTVPININATPGDYWVGFVSSTNSARQAAGGNAISLSNYLNNASVMFTVFQGLFSAAAANSNQMLAGQGMYSAATAGLPAAVSFSEIYGGSVSSGGRSPLLMFSNFSA